MQTGSAALSARQPRASPEVAGLSMFAPAAAERQDGGRWILTGSPHRDPGHLPASLQAQPVGSCTDPAGTKGLATVEATIRGIPGFAFLPVRAEERHAAGTDVRN
ncbi:hypothetical protein STAQ_50200 [Allostella sp. ATCC 35155]|nr:hypothetical protein STAQ_50200 [Stella sp. ATCC 35155]